MILHLGGLTSLEINQISRDPDINGNTLSPVNLFEAPIAPAIMNSGFVRPSKRPTDWNTPVGSKPLIISTVAGRRGSTARRS
jgi:hypothetical protein